ncbi:Hypothetical_protein [Hexamita inflata]|uniref:Hypothetical_protein n=1 Tax=Hexamita inflata TaxID=28002 RepID=A0AA86QDN2_9EUKA|nr:Hypothetical protein HINF_LOCUS44465 [Hexamita inflata]
MQIKRQRIQLFLSKIDILYRIVIIFARVAYLLKAVKRQKQVDKICALLARNWETYYQNDFSKTARCFVIRPQAIFQRADTLCQLGSSGHQLTKYFYSHLNYIYIIHLQCDNVRPANCSNVCNYLDIKNSISIITLYFTFNIITDLSNQNSQTALTGKFVCASLNYILQRSKPQNESQNWSSNRSCRYCVGCRLCRNITPVRQYL